MDEQAEEEKFKKLLGTIFNLCELSGFHLEERIVVKKQTNRKDLEVINMGWLFTIVFMIAGCVTGNTDAFTCAGLFAIAGAIAFNCGGK